MNADNTKPKRTAAEAGWHVSRYNVAARLPGSKLTAIYNTYKRTCAEYTPIELYVMSVLDQVPENNPLIGRLARRGVIADHDERDAFEAERKRGCLIPPDSTLSVTICPTLACNFECPYCFATRKGGKMAPEVQDDVVALVARMLDASKAETLSITWFGGEPLMATDVIEELSPRLVSLAEERGVYALGFNGDQYSIAPEAVVLSVMRNYPAIYVDVFESILNGTWRNGMVVYGLADAGTLVSDWHGWDTKLPAEKVEAINAFIEKVFAGGYDGQY